MTDQDGESGQVLLKNGSKPNNLNNGRNVSNKYQQECEDLRNQLLRLKSWFYGLSAVVVAGGIILIIVVAVLFGKLSHDVASHSHKPKVGEQIGKILNHVPVEELCLPCADIRLGPSPEEDLMLDEFTRKDEPKGEQCCVETPTQLLKMLELFIEKRYREEMAKGNIKIQTTDSADSEARPAAHLMGSVRRLVQPAAPGKSFPISTWIYNEDLAFTNQVSYRHGRIVVPSSGLYYVYSQVSFLEVFDIGAENRDESSHSLSHYIYRYNIIYPMGGEEKLIQNSITKCWGLNKAFGEYTSYLGAVFYLRNGDEIFVKVSNLTLIVREPKLNYFGVFKI